MKKLVSLLMAVVMTAALAGCGAEKELLSPDAPVTLTMWHVYGEQADSPMNRLISQFNKTEGREKGIIIDVTLMSNSAQIGGQLEDALAQKPGAPDLPDLFFGHPSNALTLGEEKLIDWNSHFTEKELSRYVPEFVEEGLIDQRLVVFPVSKSTHLLFVNGSQFRRFSRDTGVTSDDLATWEGFFEAADKYYEWSGGHALCAFDYLMRAVELSALSDGHRLTPETDWYDCADPAFREAWQPFAEAFVKGHICVSDLYANTQVMTGEVLAGMGSSAAVLYYNDTVTYPDNTSEPMDLLVLPMPQPAGKPAYITQAGVGLCGFSSTEQKDEAAAVFARWLTEADRNLDFVANTGYMPVNLDSFEKIDGYTFADEGYTSLYAALAASRRNAASVTEPGAVGYYERLQNLYDRLSARQGEYIARYTAGESAAALAEELGLLVSGS